MANGANALTIIISALVAIGSTVLTIFLTPWLQHHLWRYQRRAEIRLAAAKEFNRLTTEFLTGLLFSATPQSYKPDTKWFVALNVVGGDVAVLFSARSMDAVLRVDKMVQTAGPGLNPNDFTNARDAALRALYSEVIPLPREQRRGGR